MNININQLINLRGHRQEFHEFFAHNFKGGIKGIVRRGAMVTTPIFYAFGSNDVQNELLYEKIRIGEEAPELTPKDLVENVTFKNK